RLEQLTPKYLPRIPEDPFDRKPFRYRLSKGEEIDWPAENNGAAPPGAGGPAAPPGVPAGPGALPVGPGPGGPPVEPKRKVSAGQGILWSVGPDRRDDGGKRQWRSIRHPGSGGDLIYLVPLPAANKR